jgi:hypothetical protein
MKKLLILSAIAGFGGAALFYSYYLGLNFHNHYSCLVCTHILAIGPKKRLFARSVFFLGILNSLLFVTVFGICRATVKHFAQKRSQSIYKGQARSWFQSLKLQLMVGAPPWIS